jgi:subfamily B ATP-binding cassette protein MsbA
VIVIAHRLSTIEQADQIIVLEKGRVVEQGDLKHLLQLDGLFAKLYNLQYRSAQTLEN